ncbi:hypothetical protein ACJD0Z_01435 [Flavobacteriaceae bacterium M23B6Z8]
MNVNIWIQKLMKQVFEKARKDSLESSADGLAKYLNHHFQEEFNITISTRNFTRYYNGYIQERIKKIKPGRPIRDALSKYVGYKNFEDFVADNESEDDRKYRRIIAKYLKFRKKIYFLVGLSTFLGIVLALFIIKYYKKNCMVWVNDHYEKVRCSGDVLESKLDVTKLEKFRKINVCDTTTFFRNGQPAIWYSNENGKLEFFTYPGLHPITNETLDDITPEIINLYQLKEIACD